MFSIKREHLFLQTLLDKAGSGLFLNRKHFFCQLFWAQFCANPKICCHQEVGFVKTRLPQMKKYTIPNTKYTIIKNIVPNVQYTISNTNILIHHQPHRLAGLPRGVPWPWHMRKERKKGRILSTVLWSLLWYFPMFFLLSFIPINFENLESIPHAYLGPILGPDEFRLGCFPINFEDKAKVTFQCSLWPPSSNLCPIWYTLCCAKTITANETRMITITITKEEEN